MEIEVLFAVGVEPEISDAVKMQGQDVMKEASDKFVGAQRKFFDNPAGLPVPVGKCNGMRIDMFKAMVGNGYSVGVSSEVVEGFVGV